MDLAALFEMGKKMGLDGADLKDFVTEQQNIERDKRQERRNEEKERRTEEKERREEQEKKAERELQLQK